MQCVLLYWWEIPPCFDFYVVTRSYSGRLFLCALDIIYEQLSMLGKILVPWRQVYSYYCSWVVYHLNCLHNIRLCIFPVLKRRFVNSKMFSAGMLAYSEMVYVHLDWFVYKILRMLRMARNMCMHMPLSITT